MPISQRPYARTSNRSSTSPSLKVPPATASPPPSRGAGEAPKAAGDRSKSDDHEILFQKFFKSVGPRTYAAQIKRAKNGNHYLILMEGKRDEKTDEIRKTRLFVFSEDFAPFFDLVKSAGEFVKAHPVPAEVKQRRERFWAKQANPATKAKPLVPSHSSNAPRARRAEVARS